MTGVTNRTALRILMDHAKTVHVHATLPSGEQICMRVLGMGSKICGTRMDNGRLQEDVEIDWITSVMAH